MTSAVSLTPDPLCFSLDALSNRGALLEKNDRNALAVLTPALASELAAPEELILSAAPLAGSAEVGCGFGTLILEKLIAAMRSKLVACTVRADAGVVRAQQMRALADSFAPRNAVAEVLDVSVGEGVYLSAWIAFEADADDRLDGLVSIVFCADDGSEPDVSLSATLDPTSAGAKLTEVNAALTLPPAAAEIITRRAERTIAALSAEFTAATAKRHRRDHHRTCDYFDQLIHEARAPKRKIDPAAIAAKIAHLEKERRAKLDELRDRYRTRISGTLAGVIIARVPEAIARVRIRRRKEARELRLRLPAGCKTLSKLLCAGCKGATAKPAFCDDALHVLCESCLPSAQGRPSCAACDG